MLRVFLIVAAAIFSVDAFRASIMPKRSQTQRKRNQIPSIDQALDVLTCQVVNPDQQRQRRRQRRRLGAMEFAVDMPSQQPTFIMSFLQDLDWGSTAPATNRPPFSTSVWKDKSMNTLEIDRKQEESDDEVLEYLPWSALFQASPQVKKLLAQVTRQYIYGDTRGDPKVKVADVLQLIQEEFKCSKVPLVLGNQVFSVEMKRDHEQVIQILSFAAYYHLPKEITSLLFGNDNNVTQTVLSDCKNSFLKQGGWSAVSFPHGLGIRLHRSRLHSRMDRFQPIPRRWRSSHNQQMAESAVQDAMQVKPPRQRLLSREAFLSSLQKEISSTKQRTSYNIPVPFFPMKGNVIPFFQREVSKWQSRGKLVSFRQQQFLRATFLSYGVLSCSWYNLCIVWRWHRLFSLTTFTAGAVGGIGGLLSSSLHRVANVMLYSKSASLWLHPTAVTTVLAVVLAPMAHTWLQSLQHQWKASNANQTMIMISTMLLASHVAVGTCLFFLDAALLRSLIL